MRAYIDYIFHSQYVTLLTNLALAREIPAYADRTLAVCYGDLTSPNATKIASTVHKIQRHLYNATSNEELPYPWLGDAREFAKSYSGGHSTSKDPTLRQQLLDAVYKVDSEAFNGEIAWLNSSGIFPCH